MYTDSVPRSGRGEKMYTVRLKKNEEKRILAGHGWVYANEVASVEGKDKNGSLCVVTDYDGRFIGKGYINHLSKILVRIFLRNENATDDREFYLETIKRAWNYRRNLGYENSCRVVFAEADGLPALIVDKYADVLSVQFLSLGIDRKKELVADCLKEIFNPRAIYERSDVAVRSKEGLPEVKGLIFGELPDEIIINENGVKMCVDVVNGQKTGYFLDQKENRLAARKYFRTDSVLDCFCNCGGFAMNAALSAEKVIAADISPVALAEVRKNAELNGFNNIKTIEGNVFDLLRNYRAEKRTFGTIVLDPPAFCKSADEVKDAYRGYKDINIQAMKLVKSGGFLISSSCSHYMTFPLFEKMLREAAAASGRNVRFVEIRSQASDHPSLLSAEETQYLKFFVLNIM